MTSGTALAGFVTSAAASRKSRRMCRRSRGLSLLELLLVLAVLSTVFAISWPALRRPLNRSYIQGAAQQLQRDLQNGRLTAMETGQRQVFQFRSETMSYRIGGEVVQHDLPFQRRGSDETRSNESDLIVSTGSEEEQSSCERELPIGTRFGSHGQKASTSANLRRTAATDESKPRRSYERSSQRTDGRPAADRGTRSETPSVIKPDDWSAPIRFYPSGRMESAKLMLQSDDGYRITVQIQGLAGRVKITDLEPTESSEATNEKAGT